MKKKITASILFLLSLLIICSGVSFAAGNVASVNGKTYSSLQTAINKAQSGQTITLLSSVTTSSTVKISGSKKKLDINFAGNAYRYTGESNAFVISSGNVSVRGMKIQSNNYAFSIQKNGHLSISDGSCKGYIINKGALTINGGSFSTHGAMDSSHDEMIQNYNLLTVNKGSFVATVDNVIMSAKGKMIINGGTFTGKAKSSKTEYPTVFNLKQSKSIINGGKFTAIGVAFENSGNAEIYGGTYKSSGNCSVANTGSLTINGGTVNDNKKYFALYNQGNMTVNNVKVNGGIANETSGKKRLIINNGSFTLKKNSVCLNNFKGKVVVNGGSFKTAKNNAVLNEKKGTITIKDGYFSSTGGYYALWNLGTAVVTGGTFKTSGGNGHSIGSNKGSSLKISSGISAKVDYK